MVKLTIDGKNIEVKNGATIMQAAKEVGIEIPHLCYLEGINEIGACKVCVVEVLGKEKLVTACNSKVEEGMVIFTNSPKVRNVRRTNVELILSQHDCHCATCVRSGNCNLQKLANDLSILELPFEKELPNTPWEKDFPLIRDANKCIKCMRCIQVCDKVQHLNIWELQNTGSRTTVGVKGNVSIKNSDCSLCGQCITHCPTGALRERSDIQKVYNELANEEKITVVQVAPAVRAAWAEELGLPKEKATEELMVAALKAIGFDYVFDTNFTADLTIMEEGSELLERVQNAKDHKWPMFTSCCPGWVSFVHKKYPEFLENLSTAKSPQHMFVAVAKTYFANQIDVEPEKICSISIMPCVSKKREASFPDMTSAGAGQDVDIVLTTRELVRMIRSEHINVNALTPQKWDSPLGEGTGAAVIFGVTGGVMEAALRTAYAVVEGKNPDADAFSSVRGSEGRRERDFKLGDTVIRTCTVSGLGNADKLLQDIKAGKVEYDFVEVMACPGGCVGGGGQPIHDGEELACDRGVNLYALDKKNQIRFSHENSEVQKLYENFMEKPLSHKAHELLHSDHIEGHKYR